MHIQSCIEDLWNQINKNLENWNTKVEVSVGDAALEAVLGRLESLNDISDPSLVLATVREEGVVELSS